MSGYVLFAIPIFLVCALELKDPGYLKPMEERRRPDRSPRDGRTHGPGVLDRTPHGQHRGVRQRGVVS